MQCVIESTCISAVPSAMKVLASSLLLSALYGSQLPSSHTASVAISFHQAIYPLLPPAHCCLTSTVALYSLLLAGAHARVKDSGHAQEMLQLVSYPRCLDSPFLGCGHGKMKLYCIDCMAPACGICMNNAHKWMSNGDQHRIVDYNDKPDSDAEATGAICPSCRCLCVSRYPCLSFYALRSCCCFYALCCSPCCLCVLCCARSTLLSLCFTLLASRCRFPN